MVRSSISLFMAFVIFFTSGIASLFPAKQSLRVIVPEKWEMNEGDSRTLECVFSENVTDRVIEWSVSDETKATVDKFGRVTPQI